MALRKHKNTGGGQLYNLVKINPLQTNCIVSFSSEEGGGERCCGCSADPPQWNPPQEKVYLFAIHSFTLALLLNQSCNSKILS